MLKHKLRRTTEIISFNKRPSDKKKTKEKDAIYSKVRKSQTRKAEDKDKISSIADGGYFTGPESFYETPDTSRAAEEETPGEEKATAKSEPRRGESVSQESQKGATQESQKGATQESEHYESLKAPPASAQTVAPVAYLLPVPVVWCRRATPQEDFIWTSQGVEHLVRQQQLLVKDFSAWMAAHQGSTNTTTAAAAAEAADCGKTVADAPQDVSDVPSNGSSSIRKLQRILEIEEMRQFSERLDRVMAGR